VSGRFSGEIISRDFGFALAFRRRAYGRWRWELLLLVGPVLLTIGFAPSHGGERVIVLPRAR
jgi:hypothetical protein